MKKQHPAVKRLFTKSSDLEEVELGVQEAYEDPEVRVEAAGVFPAARLAEAAGLRVRALVTRFADGGEPWVQWSVEVPEAVEDQIAAVAWTTSDGKLDYSATRSTRHEGWQLTSWGTDGAPWGHRDLARLEAAFNTGPMSPGVPLGQLSEIVMTDGRTLQRDRAANTSRTARLAKRLANP